MTAVDFQKAFDTVEHTSIWAALLQMGVPAAYVGVLKTLYTGQRGTVITDKPSKSFPIKRGTKQGDPLSPSIFNAVLERVVDGIQSKWRRKGFGIQLGSGSSSVLCNLRFADDILLLATSRKDVEEMLVDLSTAANKAGLQIHMGKTKISFERSRGPTRE